MHVSAVHVTLFSITSITLIRDFNPDFQNNVGRPPMFFVFFDPADILYCSIANQST
jgi:hypothetical protein